MIYKTVLGIFKTWLRQSFSYSQRQYTLRIGSHFTVDDSIKKLKKKNRKLTKKNQKSPTPFWKKVSVCAKFGHFQAIRS